MVKKLYGCDCCGKEVESDKIPDNWVQIRVERISSGIFGEYVLGSSKNSLMCDECQETAPQYLKLDKEA